MGGSLTTGKLLIIFFLIGLFCTMPAGIILYFQGRASIEEKTFNTLSSLRTEKKRQIEAYFSTVRKQLQTFAQDITIISASKAFSDAFTHLGTQQPSQELKHNLTQYYEKEFIGKLRRNKNVVLDTQSFINHLSFSGMILQSEYLANNPNPVGSKLNLDKSPEKNDYNRAHEIYHPAIKKFLSTFGFYDIFIINADTGDIVYTVAKEVDFATNLYTGMYKDTNLARAFKAAQNANDPDFSKLVDFEAYDPSYGAPASFIAAPVFDGKKRVAVLIFQLPIEQINNIMTSNQKWEEVGLGTTGESYLVGQDRTMRSTSRFIAEKPFEFFMDLKEVGINTGLIERMKQLSTTILMLEIQTEAAIKSLQGFSGIMAVKDYRGISVLNSYAPVDIKDVTWGIITEIDTDEAYEPIYALTKTTLIVGLSSLVILLILSFLISRSINKPIAQLSTYFDNLTKNNTISLKNRFIIRNKNNYSQLLDKINQTIANWQTLVEGISTLNDSINNQIAKINTNISNKNNTNTLVLQQSAELKQSAASSKQALDISSKLNERYDALIARQLEFLRASDSVSPELLLLEDTIKQQLAGLKPHQLVTKIDGTLYGLEKCLMAIKTAEQKFPDAAAALHEPQLTLKNALTSLEESRALLAQFDITSFASDIQSKLQSFSVKNKLENLNLQNLTKQHQKLIIEINTTNHELAHNINDIVDKISVLSSIMDSDNALTQSLTALHDINNKLKLLTSNYVW